MPDSAWSSWPPSSGFQDAAFSALLAGNTLPVEAPAPLQHLADVVAALRAEPAADELRGEAGALAEFRRRAGASHKPHRFRMGQPAMLSPLLSATAVAAVCVGGFAVAGYARALPPTAQRLAHDTIRAPSDPDGRPAVRHPSPPAGSDNSRHPVSNRCAGRSYDMKHSDARRAETSDSEERASARHGSCADARLPGGRKFASDHPDGQPEQDSQYSWTGQPDHF